MTIPELPAYIQTARYANYMPKRKRREVWPEMIGRMMGMHRLFYGDRLDSISALVNHAEQSLLDKRALGSQRALQFGGDPILKHNARVYNCTVSFVDRLRFFQECFFLLLCGCGTGFSVQKHHVAKLPPLIARDQGSAVHVIEDSIEGWADAVGVLLSSFVGPEHAVFPEYSGKMVTFDPSQVRPEGAPISSGCLAPGPEPLMIALLRASWVIEAAQEQYGRLRPIDAYDVVMHTSDAVLAGGVRRSATIAMFSPDDHEMATAKTGNWMASNPQRRRSNNSAVLLRNETTYEQFMELLTSTKEWGDPGFIWTDSTEMVVNPCGEVGMWPVWVDESGTHHSGWQMCNLATVNGALARTPALFFEACRAAATLATLQAGYTVFPYLDKGNPLRVSQRIVEKEALIGVSITGMADSPDVLFDPSVLLMGAGIVRRTNRTVAGAIGINRAARATVIKPEGTSSCMLDTASGIHPWHSRRGIRHVQANVLESPYQHFIGVNPHTVFPSANGGPNTMSLAFPYEVSEATLTKQTVSALELLRRVVLVRQAWVEPGTCRSRCTQPWLRHNVSNTIHVEPDEWDAVASFIWENRQHFAGVALMGAYHDKAVRQAPFVAVLTPEEQSEAYGADTAVEAARLAACVPDTFADLWEACEAVVKAVEAQVWEPVWEPDGQRHWIVDVVLLSARLDCDIGRAIDAIKDAWLWSVWLNLRENMAPVDWSKMVEERDTVNHMASAACAGGECEQVYT